MAGPRIGSLFTGTGALDLAVMDVYGGRTVWHSQYEPPDKNGREDTNQYAAKILARHWPDVPNLGDITRIDWDRVLAEYGPVDILTGGFPCTDVSSAGKRAGLLDGTRSGLWLQMAHAISILRPKLVVIENVEGLLSARAASDVEPCAHCVGDPDVEPPLRALGAVLGDLASLGFDAEWLRIGASEVGAPHGRKRIIVLAWPAAADAERVVPGDDGELSPGRDAVQRRLRDDAPRCGSPAADTADVGHERGRGAREWWPRLADRDLAAAHASGVGRREGRPESARVEGRPDAAVGGGSAAPDAYSLRRRAEVLDLRPGQPDVDWGDYGPAIHRWGPVIGRPAPWPTDLRGRLTPVFSEWMMGYPDGWVTCTEGVPRNAMLKALGNGVVRLQGAVGIRMLHERAFPPVALPAAA